MDSENKPPLYLQEIVEGVIGKGTAGWTVPECGLSAACAAHIYRLAADRGMPEWLKGVFRQIIAIELQWAARCLGLADG